MNLLLGAYILLNVIVMVIYFKKDNGVFQLPFLASCVCLSFVAPQLYAVCSVYGFEYTQNAIWVMILCNIGMLCGHNIAKCKLTKYAKRINTNKAIKLIYVYITIGLISYLMNRDKYHGGQAEGLYVIINFFTGFLMYGFVLLLSIWKDLSPSKKKKLRFVILLLILVYLDKIIMTGRRNDSIFLFITLSYFLTTITSRQIKKVIQCIIPLFFIGGALVGTQIDNYRNAKYEGETTSSIIQDLDFSGAESDLMSNSIGEINNAIIGINYVSHFGGYDFGASNYNRLIKDFIPSGLVGGSENKKALMFEIDSSGIVSDLTASGSTMTGYFDAFSSFGWLCWIKFLIIGWIVGSFWKNKNQNLLLEIIYFSLITATLHIFTHHTSYFFNNLFFFGVFVYPFIKKTLYKTAK